MTEENPKLKLQPMLIWVMLTTVVISGGGSVWRIQIIESVSEQLAHSKTFLPSDKYSWPFKISLLHLEQYTFRSISFISRLINSLMNSIGKLYHEINHFKSSVFSLFSIIYSMIKHGGLDGTKKTRVDHPVDFGDSCYRYSSRRP